jgi:hypothetical protein
MQARSTMHNPQMVANACFWVAGGWMLDRLFLWRARGAVATAAIFQVHVLTGWSAEAESDETAPGLRRSCPSTGRCPECWGIMLLLITQILHASVRATKIDRQMGHCQMSDESRKRTSGNSHFLLSKPVVIEGPFRVRECVLGLLLFAN